LANLEAIASGCKVIGYSGVGGRDYFKATNSYEIPVGDIHAFVSSVEQLVREYNKDREKFIDLAMVGQNYVHENFSADRERKSLIKAFHSLLPELTVCF